MQAFWKRFSFLTAIVVMTLALFTITGCGGGGGGGGGGNNNNTVTGTVLDSRQQDDPVGGATVTMGGKTTTTTTVDEASADNPVGSFKLTNVETGTSSAVVTVPGQDPQTIGFSPPIADGSNAGVELIINIGQITGRILGPNGQPASGAFVAVISTGDLVETDTSGVFRIDNIPTGPTQITAVFATASATKDVTVGNGLTNVGDVQLVDDPNTTPPGSPATITGKITLSDNSAVGAGTNVILVRNGIQREVVNANANGEFFFYTPVGEYEIRTLRDGYVDQIKPASVTDPNTMLRVDFSLVPR